MKHYFKNDDKLKSEKRVLDLYINDNKLYFLNKLYWREFYGKVRFK